jgi:DNA-directed RNA polymerase subunit M/transcription elongation factor TFIIS
MTSERITCPDCKSVLRPAKPVPDGKKVKCPKCHSEFLTPGLVEEEERPRPKTPVSKAPKKKAKAAIKKAGGPKPPPKKPALDDDEDSGGIYSFVGAKEEEEEERPEINYAPDLSIKDLRGPAQEAVVKPSNFIMLIGGLSALSNIFLICWSFWPMVFSDSVVDYYKVLKAHYKDDKNALQRIEGYKEFKDLKDKDLEIVQAADEKAIYDFWVGGFPPMGRLWMMGLFILLLIYNAFAIIGAVKMQNLESRRWGIASSILMLLPMGGGGLSCLFALGINFLEQMTGFLGEVTLFYMIVLAVVPYLVSLYIGVISLNVLMSQKVIDGFEYVAE